MDANGALQKLSWIIGNKAKIIVIHYACGDLYDSSAPVRITHIACLRLQNRQCVGFSFIDKKEQNPNYSDDQVEKELLEDFFRFVSNNKNKDWLHWNMKSSSYGFNALENRITALGGVPHRFNLDKTINLAYLLKEAYGSQYARDPKMRDIAQLNKVLPKDFLAGSEEAQAFHERRLRDIGLSCNSKVGLFAEIVSLAASGKLKIRGTRRVMLRKYWLWIWGVILTFFAVIGGINDWFGIFELFKGGK